MKFHNKKYTIGNLLIISVFNIFFSFFCEIEETIYVYFIVATNRIYKTSNFKIKVV